MFKKIRFLSFLLASLLLLTVSAFAELGDIWSVRDQDGTDVARVNSDGKFIAEVERAIQFLPADFTVGADIVDGSSSPDIEEENNYACIVWDDANTTAVARTFRVPVDYLSGGAFRAFCDTSSGGTFSEIDFQVYVSTDSLMWDAFTSEQSSVALTKLAGTPELVTLTVATDFDALVAGHVVALDLWRCDVANGTADLELYYVEFYYTASQ